MIKLIRGFVIAFLSATIIYFVIFIFSPLLPLNVFEGYFGVVLFFIIVGLSFLVYLVLPPEPSSLNSSSQITKTVHSDNSENSL
ncbi:MAG: hypothetical protein JSW11_12140 [Candidatus Heimdallarchaeota archaeon]|nr:MAG: hypothetical protein JSW11_12140 [Candidatus Heimdallarchaeota archaeon]